LVEEEEMVSAPAAAPVVKEKTLFPPGGYNTQCKPPARITRADRCGPGSLEAFLESVVAARGTGGAGESTAQGVRLRGSRWAEITEAKARRQRYLRDYCPFQREDEQEEVAGHAVAEQPASCPAPEGGDDDDDDATGVRDRQARPVRGTTEYNVMRQEFLRSYS
uniref:Uncharacterized protein n=1 Tax=Oryza brachyantha TaxID=4533 RepID=J3LML1_ORYBR